MDPGCKAARFPFTLARDGCHKPAALLMFSLFWVCSGVMYSKLPFSKIKHVVEQHVAEPTGKNNNTYKAPPPDSTVEAHQQEHQGISLFVCCHASRDERCGTLGPQLVEGLMEEVQQAGLAGKVHVYECSHVGGHKVRPLALITVFMLDCEHMHCVAGQCWLCLSLSAAMACMQRCTYSKMV